LPLLERLRVEVYIPDLPSLGYQNLLSSFEEEFTYAFGGSSVLRGLEGCYLSVRGDLICKLYRFIPDEGAAADGLIRVIDESGEDYAFEAKRFHVMNVPPAVGKVLLAAFRS
jgi:hypothetical protein